MQSSYPISFNVILRKHLSNQIILFLIDLLSLAQFLQLLQIRWLFVLLSFIYKQLSQSFLPVHAFIAPYFQICLFLIVLLKILNWISVFTFFRLLFLSGTQKNLLCLFGSLVHFILPIVKIKVSYFWTFISFALHIIICICLA